MKSTFNIRGEIYDLDAPKIMGILNVTPDSFFDGGKFRKKNEILKQTEKMLLEGADLIDVGGMSSRPGAKMVSEEEELDRIIPVILLIRKRFPDVIISIDTFRSKVAREAVSCGANLINDISGGSFDNKLFDIVAKMKVPYILMHMQGTPQTMQKNPHYENVVTEVMDYFVKKIYLLKQAGVNDIILDPGFGFGKSIEQNYTLLNHLDVLKIFKLPVLVGLSRKSMVCKVLNVSPEKALNGTTILHTVGLQKGANILRVHDVKEAKEVVEIMKL